MLLYSLFSAILEKHFVREFKILFLKIFITCKWIKAANVIAVCTR